MVYHRISNIVPCAIYISPMLIAALFTIARTWKKPKCSMTDEWIKKRWYIYTMNYYSDTKRNDIGLFVEM